MASSHEKALKKRGVGSLLKFALGKTDRQMKESGSQRAIYGKDGKVKKNINQ